MRGEREEMSDTERPPGHQQIKVEAINRAWKYRDGAALGVLFEDGYDWGKASDRAEKKEELQNQVNLLATALREVLISVGMLNTEVEPNGPELLLAVEDWLGLDNTERTSRGTFKGRWYKTQKGEERIYVIPGAQPSRSVQRRIAAQKGEEQPSFKAQL